NDREYYKGGQEQLWHIDPGKDPALYTEKEGWKRLRIWGMGLASYDLDFDGFPEYFVTSMADNKLQTLAELPADGAAKAGFKDVAFAKHAIAQRPYTGDDLNPSTGWHAQFEDVNNDGLADLFIAKGNVDAMPDFALKDPNNLLLQRSDGTFEESGDRAGVAATGLSRGAGLADLNADGLVDLIVVNRREPAQIWRNTTQSPNHWLSLTLAQTAPNTDALGAWVEVKMPDHIQRREITIGGGQAGGNLGPSHFGLGDLAQAEVRVIWPDGTTGAWEMVNADAAYRLQKP
ncbi:MAG: CRTAC1 family protein, partial [Cypionkella sp.]|nr:CRTAC1 family protein [Cypionkella sp.]